MRFPFPLLSLLILFLAGCEREKKTTGDELLVTVERLSISKAKTPEDILPYDEALVWHEYRVADVVEGELTAPKIRIAHWSVVGGKAVPVDDKVGEELELTIRPFENVPGIESIAASDDLDFSETPRFIDLTQSRATATAPEAMRSDYGGFFSQQMCLYWKLRPQLKLVVMGNSHATKGICTSMFFGAENSNTPIALNLAPPGANNALQCTLIKDYISELPKLEWVVWVVSARSFNKTRKDERKMEDFFQSAGYKYDQQNKTELWPVPKDAPIVSLKDLENLDIKTIDNWGWEGRSKTTLPEDPAQQREAVIKEMDSTRFTFAEDYFKSFTEMVRLLNGKGIRVLLLTTPIHPASTEANASDPDGTTHEGFKEMVAHMEQLDKDLPLTWFRDYNKGGHHEFPAEDFYDADHLKRKGARTLTLSVIDWMKLCEKPTNP